MAKRDRKAPEPSTDDADIAVDSADELKPTGKRRSGRRAAGGSTATAVQVAAGTDEKNEAELKASRNPFTRIWLFLTQVVDELRKVVWPTRNEMIVYSIGVLVFVAVVTAVIAGLDIGFAKLMLVVFG
ncbi:preprotein translocase subunit SecE [Gordonia sp. (in: high G+C Gram-positive bacteria)]|uniref:preprotein translocase subunit SecE n=1 Tax=Gordonia sp. (in: high G+C Gram-positive bacteria) TaxID=84139 RepID=UPI0039E29AB7